MEKIQPYNANGWSYIDALHQFVDGGMTDVSFINTVSEIVTGATGSSVPFSGQRWANFNMLLTNLQLRNQNKQNQNGAGSEAGHVDFNSWFIWSGAVSRRVVLGFLLPSLLLVRFAWMELPSW